MSAWLSFLGGYAKGANEEIDKQREKEEQYIQDRIKMGAATRLQKQKEAEAQRKELEEARGELSAIPSFASAKPAQQIALLASPVIRKQFVDRTNKGEVVNLDELMTVNAKALEQFPTVDSYIKSFQAKPKAVDEQTMSAFQQPRRAFGAVTGTDAAGLEQNAARFGMKPEEALGWEAGAEEMPSTTGFATLKPQALAPTDIDGQMKLVESELLNAQRLIDSGDAEAGKKAMASANAKAIGLRTMKTMLEGGEEAINFQRKMDGVQWQIITATDPKEKKRLEALKIEMERVKDLGTKKPEGAGGDKAPTYATLRGAADSAGTRAVMAAFGDLAAKGGIIVNTDVNGNQSIGFNKLDLNKQAEVRKVYQEAAMAVFAPRLRNGVPADDATRMAMQAVGLSVKPAGGTTEPVTISMKEIVAIAAQQGKSAADLVTMYKTAKDAKGAPRYKVVP